MHHVSEQVFSRYTLNFLIGISNAWELQGKIADSTIVAVFSTVLDAFISTLTLGEPYSSKCQRISGWLSNRSLKFESEDLVELLRRCWTLYLEDYWNKILEKHQQLVWAVDDPASAFRSFLLPFANEFYDLQMWFPHSH